jgi:hypothetical protein
MVITRDEDINPVPGFNVMILLLELLCYHLLPRSEIICKLSFLLNCDVQVLE